MPPIQHLMCPSLIAWKGRVTVTGSSSMVTKRDLAARLSLVPKFLLQFHHSTPFHSWIPALLPCFHTGRICDTFKFSTNHDLIWALCTLQPTRVFPCRGTFYRSTHGGVTGAMRPNGWDDNPRTTRLVDSWSSISPGSPHPGLPPHLWTWRSVSPKSPRCSRGIRKLAPGVRLKAEHFCAQYNNFKFQKGVLLCLVQRSARCLFLMHEMCRAATN